MTTAADVTTRDRLLDVALSLFASQGYATTSVAEIQQACGLSPTSGALYRHFRSKDDLLHAAMRRGLDRMTASGAWEEAEAPGENADGLRRVSSTTWHSIEENADVLRIMFREPDAVADLIDELWVDVTARAYGTMGAALAAQSERGIAKAEDPEATSAVLLAALSYLPIIQILINRTPGTIDPGRFQEAWIRLSWAVFSGQVPT
jgi:AcrR family transcriptional regulator